MSANISRHTSSARRRFRSVRLVLALMIGSLMLSGCDFDVYKLPLPGGADVGEEPIEITVQFRNVLDLVPQSTVKVNDVNVGRVTDIELTGQTAEVTVTLRKDVDLPSNAEAKIRQTSLLGEKFVSLGPPLTAQSIGELADGDLIPLERTGDNPEVEEVLGALSLLLNGGGVAQLRTIAQEVNLALEGREESTRSALNQLDIFASQLDNNKTAIITALEDINTLALAVREQQPSIEQALAELPSAALSLDRQRDDLIEALTALEDLSDVGVRVIRQSKASTISALRQLQPTLTQLADSGDALVNSLNVLLTFPFVDEVVGRDPQTARSLESGDFTNLDVRLDLDLTDLPPLGIPCNLLTDLPPQIPDDLPVDQLLTALLDVPNLCDGVNEALQLCQADLTLANCQGLPVNLVNAVCESLPVPIPVLCGAAPGNNDNGGGNNGGLPNLPIPQLPSTPDLPVLPQIPGLPALLGLNRSPVGVPATTTSATTPGANMETYDPELATLLISPMVVQ